MWLGMGSEWEDASTEYREAISEEHGKAVEAQWHFPGELKRKHGNTEFRRLVDNGTLKEAEDGKGNKTYQTVTESERKELKHRKTLETTQRREVDDDEAVDLQKAIGMKMNSGLALDGSEFLTFLGLGDIAGTGSGADGDEGTGKPSGKGGTVKGKGNAGNTIRTTLKAASKTLSKHGKVQTPHLLALPNSGHQEDDDDKGKPPPNVKTKEEKALELAKSMVGKANRRLSDLKQSEECMKGDKSAASLIVKVRETTTELTALLELVRKHATCRPSTFDTPRCVKDGNLCVRKLQVAKDLVAKAKPYQKVK